jgi:hypothetical protein
VTNNECSTDSQCCSGHCDLNVDGKKRCTLPNECKGLGSTCTAAADC